MLSFVSTYRDRCRTTINVWGDSIGAGIIYERSKDDLKNLPDPFENEDLGKDKGEKDEDLGNDIHLIDMVKMDEDVGKDTNMPKIDEAVGIDIDRKTDEVIFWWSCCCCWRQYHYWWSNHHGRPNK